MSCSVNPENFAQSCSYLTFGPIAVAEQDQAWLAGASDGEKAWIIEICGDHCRRLLLGAGNDLAVGGTVKFQVDGMNGVVALIDQPSRDGRRQRHID